MQSTGHTSTHAVSFVPTHGSAITYAIRGLSYEEQLSSILPKRSRNNSQNFYIKKPGHAQDSLKAHFRRFHTPVELPAPNRIECTGNKFPASNWIPRNFRG